MAHLEGDERSFTAQVEGVKASHRATPQMVFARFDSEKNMHGRGFW